MSDKINDGGPAFFGVSRRSTYDGRRSITAGSLSLRDYFAIHATHDDLKLFIKGNLDDIAKARYEFADAMLKARSE